MVQSKAKTVEQYIEELPRERREVVVEVRKIILKNLPKGYTENMNWGMITYEIPLDDYPDTYNGQPLGYLGLASQKNYISLYMLGVYQDKFQLKMLKEGYKRAGLKPRMGKSCIRFQKLEQIPLNVIGELIASTPPELLIQLYNESN